MTSRVLTPWFRTPPSRCPHVAPRNECHGAVETTPILDFTHPLVLGEATAVGHAASSDNDVLRLAHELVREQVRPVYSLTETRPASRVLRLGRGSCSQRLGLVEALARANGIRTRVRGLVLSGRLWYPRFASLSAVVPAEVVLPWPEFRIAGEWLTLSDVLVPLRSARPDAEQPFTNVGGETLFDAAARLPLDWTGTSCHGSCDQSAHVVADLGHFASRDELIAAVGPTICAPVRLLGEPIFGHWSAGAA